ncbi:MAG: hypothetical protein ABID09_01595 [Candidatus Omnitrophota bacterium]
MKVEKDYEELLKLFNKNRVKYCIVGAYAVAYYARPRYTKDIDILVKTGARNARKIVKALNDFGFKSLKLDVKDFSGENNIIQLGYEPVRVDIITSIGGCSFEKVWRGKTLGSYGKETVFFIGVNELIKSKRHSKRKHDKEDLAILLLTRKHKRTR